MEAGPSNHPPPHLSLPREDLYVHASTANVSNFVSMKLSGHDNYDQWKAQMLCLMETHDMCGLVGPRFDRSSSTKIMEQYDSLLKGWIFGSISQQVLGTVVELRSAKEVWNKLKSFYDPTTITFEQEGGSYEKYKFFKKTQGSSNLNHSSRSTKAALTERKRGKRELGFIGLHSPPPYPSCATHEPGTIYPPYPLAQRPNTKTTPQSSDSAVRKLEAKDVTEGKNISTETGSTNKHLFLEEKETKGDQHSILIELRDEERGEEMLPKPKPEYIDSKPKEHKKGGDWLSVNSKGNSKPKEHKKGGDRLSVNSKGNSEPKNIKEEGVDWLLVNSKGNRKLHLVVEKGQNDLLNDLFQYQEKDVKEVLEARNMDGSTALHVAAIVGNVDAVKRLVEKHDELLTIRDNQGLSPLLKAHQTMQFETCLYLLEALKTKLKILPHDLIKIGADVLVNAISVQKYSIASECLKKFPKFATENDEVLMAIARTFPSGLTRDEKTRSCPDLGYIGMRIIGTILWSFFAFVFYWSSENQYEEITIWRVTPDFCAYIVPWMLLSWVCLLISSLIKMVFLPFFMPYFLLWKGAEKLVSFKNRIKENEFKEARDVLKMVCDEIDKLKDFGTYNGPICEAACQNAFEVVNKIISRSPQAIQCQDKCGHDIIQLAVLHRSNEIYNRVSQIVEGKNQYYRAIKDSTGNNMLHLAGRLAPSHKLNRITGAALQLQRELQWREELEKFVFPACITQENVYKETPGVVFTREHEKLVKEGEKWMKTTAESCSITAGLITTIVFAAAITVPGGSNQENGIPLFRHEIAFIIFAISDAISLFTSTITLLVFLSILTARFSEQDFLVRLPRRLIIGLCTLLVSTTTMMVAFGATLFLVFCQQKPWMLIPICASVCLTIIYIDQHMYPSLSREIMAKKIDVEMRQLEVKREYCIRFIWALPDYIIDNFLPRAKTCSHEINTQWPPIVHAWI
ncbi:hypothetical protein OSB04_015007 [Centaurea solstitialis]|uniref:PGG domain-containing protein n=1 Tax=Centaurea solstitialis TaxID=347529 RepID=A0AA38TGF3_9ASTR|nr:hypothetical protein OSB04_015007 [Centaurea solstitialis]